MRSLYTFAMSRLLLALAGVVLLAVTALGLIWLVGQLLVGVGALAVGTAGVLLKLLWFLVVAGLVGGAVYFVSNAWRPAPSSAKERPVKRRSPSSEAQPIQAKPDLKVKEDVQA